jgi:hypothetical protein
MIIAQTEIEKKRAAWWAEHYEAGMSLSKTLELNERLVHLFPMTDEEREQRAMEMKSMPEFVL